jgi:hypothetical protein
MINFEIIATPTVGKKLELKQSIDSIQQGLKKISPLFEIKTKDDYNYQFLFNLETEERIKKLFESNSFMLLTGAIKTLCEEPTVLLNGKRIRLNEISYRGISNKDEYKILINN